MDLALIRELLRVVAESGVAEVEIEEDGLKLVVRKSGQTVLMQAPPPFPAYNAMPPAFAPPPMPAYAPSPPAYAPPLAPTPPAAPAPPAAPPPAPAASNAAPAAEPPSAEAAEPARDGHVVKAPIVGTFYRSPAPDADAYVEPGDTVKPGDVLCIIEAMKLMNEIECEVAGTLRQILVENAEPVEYDQPLFVIEPA